MGSHSHDRLGVLGLDKDGDGIQACHLEALDGIPTDVQDAVLALRGHNSTIMTFL